VTRPANRLLALAAGAAAGVLLLLFYLLMQHVVDAARQQRLAADERSQLSQCWPLRSAADRSLCRDRVRTAMNAGAALEPRAQAFADAGPRLVRLDLSAAGPMP
jgi:hypothetical protein